MADQKITQLTENTAPTTDDLFVLVDAPGGTAVTMKATLANTLTDALLTTSDITTNDVSISKHGFAPKAPNDVTKFLRGDATWNKPIYGYAMSFQCLNQGSTTDGQTLYWGDKDMAPNANSGTWRMYIPKAGTITICYLDYNSQTAGTSENWSAYIRLNNTTDTLIQTLATSAANRQWVNTSLSIAVAQGDYIEIKEVCPNWATNPLNVRRSGVIFITVP